MHNDSSLRRGNLLLPFGASALHDAFQNVPGTKRMLSLENPVLVEEPMAHGNGVLVGIGKV